MKTHLFPRGRALAVAGLSAFVIPVAAASFAAASSAPTAGVSMAEAGKTQTVRYGKRIAISGRVAQGGAGSEVKLEHAARGSGYRQVAVARTSSSGSYRFTVTARRSGAYRAVAAAASSAPRRVTVVAAVSGRSSTHVLGTRAVRVRGKLRPALPGRRVSLQRATRRGWRTVDRTRTGRGGSFNASFRPHRAGAYRLRVRFGGDRFAAAASRKLRRVNVYRAGHASWYGPGLYGNGTACGGALTPGRLGVAHKSLPCGTKVTFRYRGRTATVRVIDRGPYAAGRDWDLTAATKRKLGFGSTGTVWSTK